LPTDQTSAKKFQSKILSRRSSSISVVNSQTDQHSIAEDTFDHILQVTAHNDALMAFYYLDENNKVKVTEIFDVTEADTAGLLNPEERDVNLNLEFDDRDWLNSTAWDGKFSPRKTKFTLEFFFKFNFLKEPESKYLHNFPLSG